MNKVFWNLIGNVIEAFIDDVVVKNAKVNDHVADLQKVFAIA